MNLELRKQFEDETGLSPVGGIEIYRVKYISWLENKIDKKKILCSGAGQCDFDGSNCDENNNCGEFELEGCDNIPEKTTEENQKEIIDKLNENICLIYAFIFPGCCCDDPMSSTEKILTNLRERYEVTRKIQ